MSDIKPTEPIEGDDAVEFLRKMKEVDDNPGQDKLKFEVPEIGDMMTADKNHSKGR